MNDNDYLIRDFRDGDLTGVLKLFEHTFGQRKSREWFAWKYADNPYVEGVPLQVAEHEGEIVGARPLFALPMTYNTWTGKALQPGDAMVHTAHRRHGVFTAMVEAAIDRFSESQFDFLFTFPNEQSGAGYRKLGWQTVGEIDEAFRIQRLGALIKRRTAVSIPPPLRRSLTNVHRATHRMRSSPSRSEAIRVEREQAMIPTESLSRLYERQQPTGIHARRDQAFLEWRFSNPDWEYTTYLGYTNGSLTAALVVGSQRGADTPGITRITDILPLVATPSREKVIAKLLAAVITDARDAELIVAPTSHLPKDRATRLGFRSKNSLPLSLFTEPTMLMVKPLRDRSILADHEASLDEWTLTFVEYDTA